jgi:polar amino acid transport system substrate-binding protein
MLQLYPFKRLRQTCGWLLAASIVVHPVTAKELPSCQLRVQYPQELSNGVHARLYQRYSGQLQQLATKAGCQLEQVEVPAGRAMMLMQKGLLDVMVGMSKTAERERFMYFVGPHRQERVWAVGRTDKTQGIDNLDALAQRQIYLSLTKGAYYGEQFAKLSQQTAFQQRLVFVPMHRQKIDLMINGRVDVTIEDELILNQMFSQGTLPADSFSKLFIVLENPIYFAFSKTSITEQQYQQLQQAWQQLPLAVTEFAQ